MDKTQVASLRQQLPPDHEMRHPRGCATARRQLMGRSRLRPSISATRSSRAQVANERSSICNREHESAQLNAIASALRTHGCRHLRRVHRLRPGHLRKPACRRPPRLHAACLPGAAERHAGPPNNPRFQNCPAQTVFSLQES